MYVTIQLQPISARKPELALWEACDVARRLGAAVEVVVNGRAVRISPTTGKSAVVDAWTRAAAEAAPNGIGEPHTCD